MNYQWRRVLNVLTLGAGLLPKSLTKGQENMSTYFFGGYLVPPATPTHDTTTTRTRHDQQQLSFTV